MTRTTTLWASILIAAMLVSPNLLQAGGGNGASASPSMVPVRDLVLSGQAKYQVIKKNTHQEKSEIELVLVDNEGRSIGGYAPPYLPTQAEARPLWKDFVTADMAMNVNADQISISEMRQAEDQAFAVGFALDHSRSMTIPRAVRMQRAIQSALRTFDPNDWVTITKFTGAVETEVELTNDRKEFLNDFKVNGLQSRNNGTAIYDAAMETIAQLRNAPDVNKRVMVLFTDGDDNASSATVEDVIAAAQEAGVKIHGVTYGVSNDAPIQEIAEQTGGELHRLNDVYDFDKVFLGIYNALRHSYTITVRHDRNGHDNLVQGATMTAAGSSAGAVRTSDVMDLMPRHHVEIANTPSDRSLILSIDLTFADQSHEVNPADVPLLDSIATVLIQKSDLALEILNSPESVQGEHDQQFLQRRAQAIRDLLIRRGVPPARVQSYAGKAASANQALRYADPKKTTFVFTKL